MASMACGGDKESSGSKKKATGQNGPSTKSTASGQQAFDAYDVASCETCHRNVVVEYQTSMHGRSNEHYDDIYKAVLEYRKQKEGVTIEESCFPCHHPRKKENNAHQILGLGCATCHATQTVKPDQYGDLALVATEDGSIYGPREMMGAIPGHAVGAVPEHMKDGRTLCLACHKEVRDAQDRPLCRVGPTFQPAAEPAGTEGTCVSCHMPQVRGPSGASNQEQMTHAMHAVTGPHELWYRDTRNPMVDGVDVQAAWHGDTLDVAVINKTGHTFPNGFHGRVATFEVIGFGEDGKPIWHAEAQNALPGLAGEAFYIGYVDAEGNSTIPAYAAGPPTDTRLAPYEVREFSFKPPREVVHARAMIWYRLINPELAKTIGFREHLTEHKEKFVVRQDALR